MEVRVRLFIIIATAYKTRMGGMGMAMAGGGEESRNDKQITFHSLDDAEIKFILMTKFVSPIYSSTLNKVILEPVPLYVQAALKVL
jgi:hypothetical protein